MHFCCNSKRFQITHMKLPGEPKNEKERLMDLKSFDILDTLPEKDYDSITRIASQICDTPISLITLVDKERQWFKSHHGIDETQTPRDHAFCAHAIHDPFNSFIVENSHQDERFHDNPLVTGTLNVVFYAGVPLVGPSGNALGTLCVLDNKPRKLTPKQLEGLSDLSKQVMNLLSLRKSKKQLEGAYRQLEQRNADLEQFAATAAHDIKSPLSVIIGFSELLIEDYGPTMDEGGLMMLSNIDESSKHLNNLVNSLLQFSRKTNDLNTDKSTISLSSLVGKLNHLLNLENSFVINLRSSTDFVHTNKMALEQVLQNLVSNAVKYNDKGKAIIDVIVSEEDDFYQFEVCDNGPGIAKEFHEKVFEVFETATLADKFGEKGSGIGLATVKKLVIAMGGSIDLLSETGSGACFKFSFKK